MAAPWTYLPNDPTSIAPDRALYARIAADAAARPPDETAVVPIRSGYAWEVPAGSTCRVVTIAGPQVVDFNCWNLHNPRERFWAARTRQLESTHLTVGHRLWSVLPYLRPMATVIEETIRYGVDADGGRCHDLLGSRCDPYVTKLLTGETFNFNCHSNLTRAVLPWHLNESDVHDVLNIFQVTGLDTDGRYFMKASPARQGDYFEFFAEIDLLCAVSTCPGGDLSVPLWGPEAGDPLPTCRPIGIEVRRTPKTLLRGWTPPEPSDYAGFFGLERPVWGEEG
ncbi:MAG: urea carboxylase-associated family protein [Thermomicrobiales bacterium]|nr:urea carboxylase-associated family protein [Thermomicrobiales bacterium]